VGFASTAAVRSYTQRASLNLPIPPVIPTTPKLEEEKAKEEKQGPEDWITHLQYIFIGGGITAQGYGAEVEQPIRYVELAVLGEAGQKHLCEREGGC
jgi:hypothetical protein